MAGLGLTELLIIMAVVGPPMLIAVALIFALRGRQRNQAIAPYGQAGTPGYGQGHPSRQLGGPVAGTEQSGDSQPLGNAYAFNQQGFTPVGGHFAEVDQFILQGAKINAIKVYRERTGVGLKEAQEAVEHRVRELRG